MRVAVVGRTYLVAANRAKWRYLPADIALTLVTPPAVPHPLGVYRAEPAAEWPHTLAPAWNAGRLSGFAFAPWPLGRALRRARPDLIQLDEEPSSLAALQTLWLSRRLGARLVFFTWENLLTRFPFPFNLARRLTLAGADAAIAGNAGAAGLLRQSGFQRNVAIIPQLGVDAERFAPRPAASVRAELGLDAFTVGYVGRLAPEKGLTTLLEALGRLAGDWRWLLIGRGPLRTPLEEAAAARGLAGRLRWVDTVPHQQVAGYMNALDVLVLPSQPAPRWTEQFGHVLIEAMASGVPVIGSDAGAIPEVIGDAGLLFPAGDAAALAERLERLRAAPALRRELAERGRARVLERFTDAAIAGRTVAFWREVCPCA